MLRGDFIMPNVKNFTVAEIENEIENLLSKICELDAPNEDDRYECEIFALMDERAELKNRLRYFYPYAFDSTFTDEELVEDLEIRYSTTGKISSDDILSATKISDTDAIYICKVRSFVDGKFVNNNIHIYLDNNYTDKDNMIIDATKTCNAICNVIGHEFVVILECKKVND